MALLLLPVEMVSKILTRMAILDLLSVTRTCSYLRTVCMGDRNIWKLADDAEMLPLPVGKTVDSVDMSLLLCCAGRAVSIFTALQGPKISPRKPIELRGLYDHPAWRPLLQHRPTRCYILPGAHSFLIGGSQLGLYDIHGEYSYEFEASNIPVCFTWESQDNGASIVLAVVWKDQGRGHRKSSLSVYKLDYDPASNYRNVPVISLSYSTPISDLSAPVQICMRKSIVLIWDKPAQYDEENEMFLIDIEQNKRVRLVPLAGDSGFHIIYASLHPTLPLAVLFVSDILWMPEAKRTVELVDINLFPMHSDLPSWETRYITRRAIAELGPLPFEHGHLYHTIRFEFGNIVLDEVHYLMSKISATSWTISLRSLSSETPSPPFNFAEYDSANTHFFICPIKNTPSGKMTFAFREPDDSVGRWILVQSGRQGIRRHILDIVPPDLFGWVIALDDIHGIFVLLNRGKLWTLYC
ncbi:hypothetical protein B0H10DRAFT_2046896 [Mycena sp. CBHHK59/15]|nr:hypothetical protein B0H10DRAFT_2046896 [Mycena sp. CBHHK59/15]